MHDTAPMRVVEGLGHARFGSSRATWRTESASRAATSPKDSSPYAASFKGG